MSALEDFSTSTIRIAIQRRDGGARRHDAGRPGRRAAPGRAASPGDRTIFADRFRGPRLDASRWVAHYLPHWTVPERSAARYDLLPGGGLRLRIDADQPAWRPEDGPFRVSHVQTGSWAGPPGTTRGQHRHRDGLTVRTAVPTRRLWTPSSGSVAVRASATADPACMLGIWLVGFEERSPYHSGEICVAEVFGDRVGRESVVRAGIKAHHDPLLVTELSDVVVPVDATQPHTYAASWGAAGVRVSVDGRPIMASRQRLAYPLQLMIDLFEFPDDGPRDSAGYPRSAVVHWVVGRTGPTTRPRPART